MAEPKGYWIARVDVTDMDTYKQYGAAVGDVLAKFGGRFLARGGTCSAVEGHGRSRNVIVEFPSYRAALECYHSDDYAPLIKLRQSSADSELIVVEGYDGA